MLKNELYAFIALWNKDLGAKIIDFYPKSMNLDLDLITTQIFIAFQSFYYNESEDKKIKRTFFKLPIKNINKKASIFLDSLKKSENQDNIHPFIVVFLFPGYFSDEELKDFDKLIYNIGTQFINNEKIQLKYYFNEIYELFTLKEKVQDADIKIDEEYSFNEALLDFKNGMEQYSRKKFDQSYFFLKKAHLKFKNENKIHLLLETFFFLGSVLSQLNKLKAAQEYFEKLEDLSHQLQHKKYYENAIFMDGFCAYKTEDFDKALIQFKKLDAEEIQYINKFQFYFLYGRLLRLAGLNDDAIEKLLKAYKISNSLEASMDLKEKRAKLILELGHTNYNLAIQTIKAGKVDRIKLASYLNNTINNYKDAIKIWEDMDNFPALIDAYQLIGNIYSVLNEHLHSIENYRKALYYAELTNDIFKRLHIFNLIIQTFVRLEMHEVIVKEIDEMLSKIVSYAFMDLLTISGFHRQLGIALFKLGKEKEALSELLIALNIHNKFDTPSNEALLTLENIIEIYKNTGEEKYIQYYEEEYNKLKDKIQLMEIKEKFGILGDVKEIWFIYDDGTTLFSYTPETSFDPNLFGSFISALQSFSLELTSKQLNSITMGRDQYTFYIEEKKPFFIMGRSNVKASLNAIIKVLQELYNQFWNQYKSTLEKFDGFVTRYSNFIKQIETL
ncbi:MAG: tetratricopeptide repeat protein [Promethearchaeota archaeon]